MGELRVDTGGFYRVELDGANGLSGPASLDYTIDVIPDRPPTVAVAEPGRDARVTRLEELFTSVEADDDFGVARVDLVYAVKIYVPNSKGVLKIGMPGDVSLASKAATS